MAAASALELGEGSRGGGGGFGTQRQEAPPKHGVSECLVHRKELGNRKCVVTAACEQGPQFVS